MDVPLVDERGATVKLRDVVRDGRPFIIVPAYYSCPRLCGLVLKAVHDLVLQLGLKLNEDFRIITVSFDPQDTPAAASERAAEYRKGLEPSEAAAHGWRFLTGSEANVSALMNQIGFHYLEDSGEFAHSAAIMILTPEGQISQYFTGISFTARDAKLALVEAGRGSIGSAMDHFLLFCFRFDQTKGRYTWAAFNVMRAGGVLTLVLLAGLILVLRRRERTAAPNH
ncbi:MAG: SCO family protein [Deltaproteobacteria bacterium]|nr:SCO family protein [Deltaproteobacteria bacterium]